jgi:hypothetical protein
MKPFRFAVATFAVVLAAALAPPACASQDVPKPTDTPDMSGLHDFDFLVGEWRVHSRRLKEALAGSHEWYAFEGSIVSRPLMEGRANVDDTVFHLPQGIYRGVAPRAYDPKTGQWAIWWIDGRNPFGNLDPPVKGKFVDGVGTFYASDTLRGKPIKVRFIWSQITKTTARWEQAYSPDDGKTWETNWEQTLERTR